jgi:hypothetical protein
MEEFGIDIAQGREQIGEELVSRPAGLAESDVAPEVELGRDDLGGSGQRLGGGGGNTDYYRYEK